MAKSDSDSGSLWQDQPELPTQMVGLDRLQSKAKIRTDFLTEDSIFGIFESKTFSSRRPHKGHFGYTALHSSNNECRNYYIVVSLLHHATKIKALILVLTDYHPTRSHVSGKIKYTV